MYKIRAAVCDDDVENIARVTQYVRRMCDHLNAACELYTFQDGEELLAAYPPALDLLFLDIEMPFVNGIEAAKLIRKRDAHVIVVFLSNYDKYAIQGYEVGAWRYLLKPLGWDEFEKEMHQPFEKCLTRQKSPLYVRNKEGVYSVSGEELYYAATNLRKSVDLHTRRGKFECYQTLTAVEKHLAGQGFFRCHSGFLVNFSYVHQIGRDFLTMKDGTWIPVSKHRKKELLQAFASYAGDLL